jgi:ribose 5-phosphate isomerase A
VAENTQNDGVEAVGEYALRYVKPGVVIGLGTGRAATAFIKALGKSGIRVRGVPTSVASENLARELGIEIVSLDGSRPIDVTLDGADEVGPKLNMIKGWGGALVREKIVAAASRRRIMLVGADKIVKRLGERGKLPVEVVPFALPFCSRQIAKLGLKPNVRKREDGSEFITDNGNLILDCATKPISKPAELERDLRAIPGVVGTGLFLAMADIVLVGESGAKVRVLKR